MVRDRNYDETGAITTSVVLRMARQSRQLTPPAQDQGAPCIVQRRATGLYVAAQTAYHGLYPTSVLMFFSFLLPLERTGISVSIAISSAT